jgi:hypothetical protein
MRCLHQGGLDAVGYCVQCRVGQKILQVSEVHPRHVPWCCLVSLGLLPEWHFADAHGAGLINRKQVEYGPRALRCGPGFLQHPSARLHTRCHSLVLTHAPLMSHPTITHMGRALCIPLSNNMLDVVRPAGSGAVSVGAAVRAV